MKKIVEKIEANKSNRVIILDTETMQKSAGDYLSSMISDAIVIVPYTNNSSFLDWETIGEMIKNSERVIIEKCDNIEIYIYSIIGYLSSMENLHFDILSDNLAYLRCHDFWDNHNISVAVIRSEPMENECLFAESEKLNNPEALHDYLNTSQEKNEYLLSDLNFDGLSESDRNEAIIKELFRDVDDNMDLERKELK